MKGRIKMLKTIGKNMNFDGSCMKDDETETLATFSANYSMDRIYFSFNVDPTKYINNKETIDVDFEQFKSTVIETITK